jgi:tetratricopeptide (TPR) repeat protein
LLIENRALELTAPIRFLSSSDCQAMKGKLRESLRLSQGRYGVSIVALPSGNPVFFSISEGSMDLTGKLDKALHMRQRGRMVESVDVLQDLAKETPEVANVLVQLGHTCRALAKQEKGGQAMKWLRTARESYEQTLQSWPNWPDALAGLGMVKRMQDDVDGAMEEMEKALRLAPLHLANLLTYSFYGILKYQGDPEKLLAFLEKHLTPAYNFLPMHAGTLDFLNQLRAKFGIELRLMLEMTEVDARYQ